MFILVAKITEQLTQTVQKKVCLINKFIYSILSCITVSFKKSRHLTLLLIIFSLILTSCQFTRHGVVRNPYKQGDKYSNKELRSSDRQYRYQDGKIWIKVLVYKGKELYKNSNNVSLKGNNVLYGGRSYTLKNGQVTFEVAREKPLVLKGHSYFGKVIIARKNYIYVVNIVPIEEYLVGVVQKEISYSWPEEAIKAQAIAARSYAYRKYLENQSKPYHLKGSTSDQVFGGTLRVHENIVRGVKKTRGQILVYNSYPILTFFHASCGGMTEKAEDVWLTTKKLPYFKNIRCHYCTTHPKYSWKYQAIDTELYNKLSRKLGKQVTSFYVQKKSPSGRVSQMTINTKSGKTTMSGNNFRLAVSPKELFSTKFKIRKIGKKYYVTGNGFGHGVGLCQWGAKTLGEKGYSYSYILKFYYKNIRFSTIDAIEKRLHSSRKVLVQR